MADAPPQLQRRLILRIAASSSSTSSSTTTSDSTTGAATPYTDPTTTAASTASPAANTPSALTPGSNFAVGASVYRLSDGKDVGLKQWRIAELMPPEPHHKEPVYRIWEGFGNDPEVYLAQEHELYNPPAASLGDPIWIQPFGVQLKITGISLERRLGPGFRYTCDVEEGVVSIRHEWLDWE